MWFFLVHFYYYFLASPVIITATDDNSKSKDEEKSAEIFVDNWTYKNHAPHNTPLLPDVKKNHTLPETANDTVSTYLSCNLVTLIMES